MSRPDHTAPQPPAADRPAVRTPAPATRQDESDSAETAWREGRRACRKDLLRAVPAVVFVVAALATISASPSSEDLVGRYVVEVSGALKARSLSWAVQLARKLERLTAGNPNGLFQIAMVLDEAGRPQEAAQRMVELAVRAAPPYVNAVQWLIGRIRSRNPVCLAVVTARRAEVEAALKQFPSDTGLRELLARLASASGRPREAIPHFEELATRSAWSRLDLAQACLAAREPDRAKQHARAVKEQALKALRTGESDPGQWLLAMRASLLLAEYQDAVELFQKATRIAGGVNPDLQVAAAQSYMLWGRSVLVSPKPDVAKALELLLRSASFPDVPAGTFIHLSDITLRNDPSSQQAKEALEDALVKGRSPALVHTLLGTVCFMRGNKDEAQKHWRASLDMDPRNFVSLNNLAWILMDRNPPQLEQALSLVETALELAPRTPAILDTRGRILARLGRHREALVDLEQAMAGLTEREKPHAVLAEVYEKLGMADLAAKHRQQVPAGTPPEHPGR